ncbi:MAG: carbohydrate kinase family protein [Nitrososphaeria archaeon]
MTTGFVVTDILATELPKLPAPGEGVIVPPGIKVSLGGHPANVSVDLRQLGLKRGEVRTALAVGDDMFGDFVQDFLRSRGVIGRLQRVKGTSTGISLVLVVKGQDKAIVGQFGANLFLDFDYVMRALKESKSKILYVASGILGDFDLKLKDLLEYCHRNGVHTVVDLTRPHGKDWSYSHPALPYMSVLHSNVQELQGVTGQKEQKDGLKWLVEKGVKFPIVSDGRCGSMVLFKGNFIKQPAFDVNAIDPTGAGDAMCAGTIRKLLDIVEGGGSIEKLTVQEAKEILLFAQAAGAACVEEIGTTTGVTMERVSKILKEQGERILFKTIVEEK